MEHAEKLEIGDLDYYKFLRNQFISLAFDMRFWFGYALAIFNKSICINNTLKYFLSYPSANNAANHKPAQLFLIDVVYMVDITVKQPCQLPN